MSKRKTILATAYAVNPYKGSEEGMGWNFIIQISRFNSVIAITRRNNREAIERYCREHTEIDLTNITFIYFDLPHWMRFWKKGSRGAMVYYWMWQRAIPAFVKQQRLSFDIVHNLNFRNDWTPSHLWKLNKPFVWGPIGHHPKISKEFRAYHSWGYQLREHVTWGIKNLFWRLSPALKNTIQYADHILCMNSDVARYLCLDGQAHSIMPSVASADYGVNAFTNDGTFTMITAGRLIPLKGFDLAILSFARFINGLREDNRKKCRLVIVGSGPLDMYLQTLAKDLGVQNYIQFVPWLERKAMLDKYKTASAFLFPSHEGAGVVVAEALSFGLPVICLKNTGPGELVDGESAIAVTAISREDAVCQLSKAIMDLFIDPALRRELATNARRRFEQHLHWDRRGSELYQIYQKL